MPGCQETVSKQDKSSKLMWKITLSLCEDRYLNFIYSMQVEEQWVVKQKVWC